MSFKTITVHELAALLKEGNVRLIDVRRDDEVAQGMIEGAEHIELQKLPQRVGEIDPNVPTAFFCRSGNRSAQACQFLVNRGNSNVINVTGGVLDWTAANLPLVKK